MIVLLLFQTFVILVFTIAVISLSISARESLDRPGAKADNVTEDDAKAFLEDYDKQYSELLNKATIAEWNYTTNLSDYNANISAAYQTELTAFTEQINEKASAFNTTHFSEDVKRKMKKVSVKTLDEKEMNELNSLVSQMGRIYGEYKVCQNASVNGSKSDTECFSLEPGLSKIMAAESNYARKLWAWESWHDGVGRKVRPLFTRYVELKNKLARLNGYEDAGDEWRQKYETKELANITQRLYDAVEPLYKQLHAYVRSKLIETYGPKRISRTGPLPGHLLGDMWGRFWVNLNKICQPYPDKPSVDPTPQMIRQNYTVRRMFEMGNEYFTSMGLKTLPSAFFDLSMLEKPIDRDVTCHATAWEFSDGEDYRIRMCAQVNFEDFQTIHHELGHIQYFMQYAHQPVMYREGANDGFHEAVGELVAMSVATTKHLNSIGLLDVADNDPDTDINFLLSQALNTVSTLPFHSVMDEWRWRVFAGEISPKHWNTEFWKMTERTVGVKAPKDRDPLVSLDPVALFHVVGDFDMIRYFIRTILQYQFAESLCNAAGHTGPLYKCDIYGSKKAGKLLEKMLQMGSSKPWQDAMEVITGQREMKIEPLLNYFEPLRVWLEKTNKEQGNFVGWV